MESSFSLEPREFAQIRRFQSFNVRAHKAFGCRLWAALVGAQPYGVGGDGPTGLSSPEIAKLRDQQAQ